MADNITLNAGTGGATLAADDITSVWYQIIKLAYGALDSATLVTTSSGLPVQAQGAFPVTDNAGSLTVDGTVAVSGTVTVDSELTTADLDTGAGTDTRAVVGLALAASGGALLVGSANPLPISDNSGSITVDGTVTTSPPANASSNVAQINGVTPLMGNGVTGTGSLRVTVASDNTAFTVNAQPTAVTTGGATVYHLASAASTNATNVKASAGTLYGWSIQNTNAAARYVAFHNSAGTPTAGASVAFKVLVPGASAGAGNNFESTVGIAFATGIAITTVTGAADSDTTAVGANDLLINLFYK